MVKQRKSEKPLSFESHFLKSSIGTSITNCNSCSRLAIHRIRYMKNQIIFFNTAFFSKRSPISSFDNYHSITFLKFFYSFTNFFYSSCSFEALNFISIRKERWLISICIRFESEKKSLSKEFLKRKKSGKKKIN